MNLKSRTASKKQAGKVPGSKSTRLPGENQQTKNLKNLIPTPASKTGGSAAGWGKRIGAA
jgi:hypothetical protein